MGQERPDWCVGQACHNGHAAPVTMPQEILLYIYRLHMVLRKLPNWFLKDLWKIVKKRDSVIVTLLYVFMVLHTLI